MDADEILRRQPWLPEDVERLPGRVRDAEEEIRTHEDRIDYFRDDMDSVKSLLTRCLVGITVLAVEGGAAVVYLLLQYLANG